MCGNLLLLIRGDKFNNTFYSKCLSEPLLRNGFMTNLAKRCEGVFYCGDKIWVDPVKVFLLKKWLPIKCRCHVHGTSAGRYASQRFSASCAAQPKGCSACWVHAMQNQYWKLNRPTKVTLFKCSERKPYRAVFKVKCSRYPWISMCLERFCGRIALDGYI